MHYIINIAHYNVKEACNCTVLKYEVTDDMLGKQYIGGLYQLAC